MCCVCLWQLAVSKRNLSGGSVGGLIQGQRPHTHEYAGAKGSSGSGSVELRSVSFRYPARPEVQVFSQFSLKVQPGRSLALVGQSGSGKSTVISLIERFYDVEAGQVCCC